MALKTEPSAFHYTTAGMQE